MSVPFEFDEEKYLELIIAINHRFARALDHLKDAHGQELSYLAAEEFALQVRMICESILASSFVIHQKKYIQVIGKVSNPSKANALAKELKELNKGFFPKAVETKVDTNGGVGYSMHLPDQISAQFLIRIHGICGQYVHMASPTKTPHKLSAFGSDFDRFLKWMNRYLAGHAITLFQTSKTFLFDGAGVVKGKPALFSLSIEKASWTLEFVQKEA